MSKPSVLILISALALSGAAHATDLYPWRQHEAPFNFVFGNGTTTPRFLNKASPLYRVRQYTERQL